MIKAAVINGGRVEGEGLMVGSIGRAARLPDRWTVYNANAN